jgi:hypothetical protein
VLENDEEKKECKHFRLWMQYKRWKLNFIC